MTLAAENPNPSPAAAMDAAAGLLVGAVTAAGVPLPLAQALVAEALRELQEAVAQQVSAPGFDLRGVTRG